MMDLNIPKSERRRTAATTAASLAFAALGASTLLYAGYQTSSSSDPALRAQHSRTLSGDDGDSFCTNTPTLHDMEPHWVDRYDRMIRDDWHNFDSYKLPELVSIKRGSFRTTVRERNWPARSMAWNDTFSVQEDETIDREYCEHVKEGHGVWRDVPTLPSKRMAERTFEGDYAAFSGWYVGNFGHFVHDHVPVIAWMKSNVPESTKFLLPYNPLHENIMKVVDPKFVEERVVWIEYDQTVKVEGTLTVLVPKKNDPFPCGFPQTAAVFTEHLRAWLEEAHRELWEAKEKQPKKVIFYTRSGGTARRNLDKGLEDMILKKIRESMVKYGRAEDELVIFNGKDPSGETFSIQEQFDLFSSADVLIGPHGSGMTNMIWMDPRRRPCGGTQNKILEFSSSMRTKQVQSGAYSSYWFLFGSTPWLDYHNLYYLPRSTPETVVVNLEAFEKGLEALWEGDKVKSS